jgi:hypothetical protein
MCALSAHDTLAAFQDAAHYGIEVYNTFNAFIISSWKSHKKEV